MQALLSVTSSVTIVLQRQSVIELQTVVLEHGKSPLSDRPLATRLQPPPHSQCIGLPAPPNAAGCILEAEA